MTAFSKIAAPLVGLLDASVFRLFGQLAESEQRVTDEEIRTLIAEAETAGVIETGERQMIAGVMRLGVHRDQRTLRHHASLAPSGRGRLTRHADWRRPDARTAR